MIIRMPKRRDELRRLRSWKADATSVLERWHEVAAKVPEAYKPLGEMESTATGRYIEHLKAENARLADKLTAHRLTP
jgi:hypothetical protein